MSDERLLDQALERGIITDAQRRQIDALKTARRQDPDERIRTVSNLNELFVTFGVMLLLNALTGLSALLTRDPTLPGALGTALPLAAAYLFHRRKRFRLPVIYGIISAAFAAGTLCYYHMPEHSFAREVLPMAVGLLVLAGGAACFRTPFIMLPISIAFAYIVTVTAQQVEESAPLQWLLGASGLSIIAFAIYCDLKDPERTRRWSDFAFWSYVVGSPLFVHSLFLGLLVGDLDAWKHFSLDLPTAGAMLLLIVAVTFTGLALNRRALILSTLVYVGYIIMRGIIALGSHGKDPFTNWTYALLFTLVILGTYVILLGSHWMRARRAVMRRLPPSRWLARLPPW